MHRSSVRSRFRDSNIARLTSASAKIQDTCEKGQDKGEDDRLRESPKHRASVAMYLSCRLSQLGDNPAWIKVTHVARTEST